MLESPGFHATGNSGAFYSSRLAIKVKSPASDAGGAGFQTGAPVALNLLVIGLSGGKVPPVIEAGNQPFAPVAQPDRATDF